MIDPLPTTPSSTPATPKAPETDGEFNAFADVMLSVADEMAESEEASTALGDASGEAAPPMPANELESDGGGEVVAEQADPDDADFVPPVLSPEVFAKLGAIGGEIDEPVQAPEPVADEPPVEAPEPVEVTESTSDLEIEVVQTIPSKDLEMPEAETDVIGDDAPVDPADYDEMVAARIRRAIGGETDVTPPEATEEPPAPPKAPEPLAVSDGPKGVQFLAPAVAPTPPRPNAGTPTDAAPTSNLEPMDVVKPASDEAPVPPIRDASQRPEARPESRPERPIEGPPEAGPIDEVGRPGDGQRVGGEVRRITEPLVNRMVQRIEAFVRRAENVPPPRAMIIRAPELNGMSIRVTVNPEGISIVVQGASDTDTSWIRDVGDRLSERGFELTDLSEQDEDGERRPIWHDDDKRRHRRPDRPFTLPPNQEELA